MANPSKDRISFWIIKKRFSLILSNQNHNFSTTTNIHGNLFLPYKTLKVSQHILWFLATVVITNGNYSDLTRLTVCMKATQTVVDVETAV